MNNIKLWEERGHMILQARYVHWMEEQVTSYQPVVVYFAYLLCRLWLNLSYLVGIGWVTMEELNESAISVCTFVHFKDRIVDRLVISLIISRPLDISNSLHCSDFVAQYDPERQWSTKH